MSKYTFTTAIAIRAYGTVDIEADSLEEAKEKMARAQMSKVFEPHGSGDDDFDYDYVLPAIYLESVMVDDDEETELDEELEAEDY